MNDKNSETILTVYRANQKNSVGLINSWLVMIANVVNSRTLIWQLFKRDFISGYKQSIFGAFWIFIAPLVGIVSWVFMNATGILNTGNIDIPYPVFVLLGTTLWGLFMSFYSGASNSLASGASLILQVKFCHEALVAQQIAQTVSNFLINLVMVVLVLLVFGVIPTWKAIFFPLTILPLFFLGTGIGMLVAVITVVVHDITRIVSTGLGLLMFLTPVVYAPSFQNPAIQFIMKWNPLTYLIGGAREILVYGYVTRPQGYLYSSLFALTVFLFSWRLFSVSEHKVAEKL